jgi:hypothetical protein
VPIIPKLKSPSLPDLFDMFLRKILSAPLCDFHTHPSLLPCSAVVRLFGIVDNFSAGIRSTASITILPALHVVLSI